MTAAAVLQVLAALESSGCATWVAGGWGVDALVGRQTRPHRDVDLAVDARSEARTLSVLTDLGYRIETDWRPVRVELRAPGGGWVDLHPVTFRVDGAAVQPGLDGASFVYAADCFVLGSIDGRTVGCLSVEQQIAFHTGYPPREVDLADLRELRSLVQAGAAERAPHQPGAPASVRTDRIDAPAPQQ